LHKQTFRKQIVFSSILTAIAVVAIVVFCVCMFKRYSPPTVNNTSVISGTVTEVYYGGSHYRDIEIAISNDKPLILVAPYSVSHLCDTIGYDVDQLAQLLEGKTIEYRRMNGLPWIVEINVGDTKIDNNKLSIQQMVVTRVAIVIPGLLMLVISISCYVVYLKAKYKRYLKAKKKQERKEKRKLKLMAKESNKAK
jgi:hypothetical protein